MSAEPIRPHDEKTDDAALSSKPVVSESAIPVTVQNFVRAETEMYFSAVAIKERGFGKFEHKRELSPIDQQNVIRQNRDTLYSAAVFDLDGGPVTITLPETKGRFMSLQLINQDEYTLPTIYEPGPHKVTKEQIGTRYFLAAVRTFIDPSDPKDVDEAHRLQDLLKVDQKSSGKFEVPKWDAVSQKKVREALLVLASTVTDTKRAFGARDEVDPIQHLIGAASAWGANSPKDAIYLNVTPKENDGITVHRLKVKDVPVEGFWSVIVYNADGFIPQNDRKVYSFNNVTAKKDVDGSVTIQFGGFDGKTPNCLQILPGWNYMVRLYRPRKEVLDGTWKFPEAEPTS
jgi:hypothetical protein